MERDHHPVDHNHSPAPALRDVEVVEVVGEMEAAGGDDSGSGERHTHTSYGQRSGHSMISTHHVWIIVSPPTPKLSMCLLSLRRQGSKHGRLALT